MREAVEQYPILASGVVHQAIEAVIAEGAPEGSDGASLRRLEWLRQIPLSRLGEAQYAFLFAKDDTSLKAALDEHPEMRTSNFERSVKRSLGERSDWPLVEKRLERLRSLIGDAGERQIVDEAFREIQEQNPESALERLKKLPQNADYSSRVVRAAAHAEAGRRSEAVHELTSLIAEHPHPIVLRMRGRLLVELERFREAIVDFTEALKLDPQDAEAWLGRGLAYSCLDLRKESINDFTRAEQLGEYGPVYYTQLLTRCRLR
jgi:tetratricopeptide (TPR) repeat protein